MGALWEPTTVDSDGKNKTEIYTWKVEKKRWPGGAKCCYFVGVFYKIKVFGGLEFS